MKCDLVQKNIAAYVDGVLSPSDRRDMEQHCEACAACRAMLEEEVILMRALASLPQEELPQGFKERFRERLAAEPPRAKRAWYKQGWVKTLGGVAAAACLLLVVGLGAIGGMGGMATKEADMAYYDTDYLYSASTTGTVGKGGSNGYQLYAEDIRGAVDYDALKSVEKQSDGIALASEEIIERKIIRDAELRLSVEDFASAYAYIEALPEQFGGYLVSSERSDSGTGRYTGTLVLRVDAARLDEVLALIGELGQVSNQRINSSDITAEYYDIQSSLTQYREHEARLMELIDEAKGISDLLQLEDELNRVRVEIEGMEGRLRYFEQVTELSKITVYLYSSTTTGSNKVPFIGWSEPGMELRNAFVRGINTLLDNTQNLLVFFIGALPTLVVAGLVIGGVVYLFRRKRRK